MGCCCSDCCRDDDSTPKSFQDEKIRHSSADLQRQGMGYASSATHRPTERTGSNDYHTKILNLQTLHKNFMHEVRRYQISVYRGHFGAHHYIVISDGVNEDITLELTVDGEKSRILSSQEKVMAAVQIYREPKCDLDNKGVVECTLHMLTEIAANVLSRNPNYNLLNNNCQDFCNAFLNALKKKTYMTDPTKAEIVTGSAIFSSMAASYLAAGSKR